VTLGLDLRGGSHVLLEVDREDLEDQLARQLIGDIRQTMREERIRYSGLGRQNGIMSVRITEEADFDRAYERLRPGAAGVGGILRSRRHRARVRAAAPGRPGHLRLHHGGCRGQDRPRRAAVAGDRRASYQRPGHHRADHPAPRNRSHPGPGSRASTIPNASRTSWAVRQDCSSACCATTSPSSRANARRRNAMRCPTPSIPIHLLGADLEPCHGGRRTPGRRPAGLRCSDQRADRQLPLQSAGGVALRQADPGKCRTAVRHRARQ
jgi:hypothetical protein